MPYYGDTTRVQVEDDSQVLVQVTDLDQIEYAELRVGISRAGGLNRKVIINFNGVELNVPYEDSAIRLDNGEDYATCKIIRLPADQILAENRVNVSFPDGKGGAIGSVVLRVVSTHKPLKPAVTTFGPTTTAATIFGPTTTASTTFGPTMTAATTYGPTTTAATTFGPTTSTATATFVPTTVAA